MGPGQNEEDELAPNWAYIHQKLMEAYSGYTLLDLWELTLPEITMHLEKLLPRVTEPDWFVEAWRGAKTGREKMLAMQKLMG